MLVFTRPNCILLHYFLLLRHRYKFSSRPKRTTKQFPLITTSNHHWLISFISLLIVLFYLYTVFIIPSFFNLIVPSELWLEGLGTTLGVSWSSLVFYNHSLCGKVRRWTTKMNSLITIAFIPEGLSNLNYRRFRGL